MVVRSMLTHIDFVELIVFSKTLNTQDADFEQQLNDWIRARSEAQGDEEVRSRVEEILNSVRDRGDEALKEWTQSLEQRLLNLDDMELPVERVWAAVEQANADVVEALELAHERLLSFHEAQLAKWTDHEEGPAFERSFPIERVGVYVPGGLAAYPSTVLMNVVPARVAGVEEIIMVSPTFRGAIPEAVLAAAAIAGVDRVFKVGGAQAIGALAYGTEKIPKVDKIVGPGNQYVAEAKRQVFGRVGIDMVAGPSEVLVVCDELRYVDLVAADLLAQAEHDPQAIPILIASDNELLGAVESALAEQLDSLPRKDIATQSLSNHGLAIVARDPSSWADLCNQIAPEHLELLTGNAESLASEIRFAGALFIGPWSPEAFGDYAAGPDHVLPTSGTARFSSPLGVQDFTRRMSVMNFSAEETRSQIETVVRLAKSEGLEAHARSMSARETFSEDL